MNNSLFKKFINISAPVLITGQTGTGKSRAARRLFDLSDIHKDKFLTIHLASLKEDLFESELFGHKKGSFTGAVENKTGYLGETGKGTLFLDEIGELSLEAQKKLLYLLEEKKFTPVGATAALNFEGRLVMATNKNLKALVEEGKFREDLYFRLSIFQIELAPLAEDREKLLRMIQKQLEWQKQQYKKPHLSMSPELLLKLTLAPWKGNYRELKNCMEYMVAMSESPVLEASCLPHWFSAEDDLSEVVSEKNFISHFPGDYSLALEQFEALYLKTNLIRYQGRVNETARLLGISKTTLISKAKKYGIDTLSLRAEAGRQKSRKWAA